MLSTSATLLQCECLNRFLGDLGPLQTSQWIFGHAKDIDRMLVKHTEEVLPIALGPSGLPIKLGKVVQDGVAPQASAQTPVQNDASASRRCVKWLVLAACVSST